MVRTRGIRGGGGKVLKGPHVELGLWQMMGTFVLGWLLPGSGDFCDAASSQVLSRKARSRARPTLWSVRNWNRRMFGQCCGLDRPGFCLCSSMIVQRSSFP
jgi:hypothetical protein